MIRPLPKSPRVPYATLFRSGQIQTAVAIEVAHGNGQRSAPGREVPRRLEAPIPVAQKHRYGASGSPIGHGQIQTAVAIEVAYRNGRRSVPGGEVPCRLER